MQIYLVGGAVRDQLLGLPVHERDWVVVGATPEQMLKQGYRQVGKDFPVFLHPKTSEEYALARTERKSGHGYTGFTVHADQSVTLEEDLRRRDLTINAIAQDDQGNIIDPYHGVRDLENKLLRHVSPAFSEDPLRLLRIARFKARYHRLGFQIADETKQLLLAMVRAGEVSHLVRDRVWLEIEKTLPTENPEEFFQVLRGCGALKILFKEIDALFGVPNPPKHHPEIDSGVHTLMVLQQAVKLSKDPIVRFAALVHDLGKAVTPMDCWPSHRGHDVEGIAPIEALCTRYPVPKEMQQMAILASQFHIRAHNALAATPKELLKILTSIDAFRRPQRLEQFLLTCLADVRGRPSHEEEAYPQAERLRQAFQAAQSIDIAGIVAKGAGGAAIGEAIHQARLAAIRDNCPRDEQT